MTKIAAPRPAPILLSAGVPEAARQFVAGAGLAPQPARPVRSPGAVGEIDLDLIVDNHYQVRVIDPDAPDIAELAESIKAHGLINPINVRPMPDGTYETKAGHRRRAAFRLLAKTDPAYQMIPAIVAPATDREMFEVCAVENGQRRELSPIEKAITCRDYIVSFKATQAQAGALIGGGQSYVAQLLRLLVLPNAVQDLVQRRELAETPARALVPLVNWRPDLVIEIAAEAVKETEPGKRAGRVDTLIDEALRRHAQTLDNTDLRPWPLEWPGEPLKVPMDLFMSPPPNDGTHQTVPAEVPACKGCAFHIVRNQQHRCTRQACFVTKRAMWAEREVARVATKLEMTAAAPGEAVTVIFPSTTGGYNYGAFEDAKRLVAARLPELRIVARPRQADGQYTGSAYGLTDMLGSESVALATVNQAAVSLALAKAKGQAPRQAMPEKPAHETPAQAEKRKLKEKEIGQERAIERMAANRAKADLLWLVESTALEIADRAIAAGGLLALAEHLTQRFFNVGLDEMKATVARLSMLADVQQEKFERMLEHKAGPSTPETDRRRRQLMAYTVLASEVAGYHNATDVYKDFEKARETAERVATKTFGVLLHAGWSEPPVHHTPINCWTCGRFSAAGAGKLTQGDVKEGWRALYTNKTGKAVESTAPGATLGIVFCPEHTAGIGEWVRQNLKVAAAVQDADLAKQEAKAKPAAKRQQLPGHLSASRVATVAQRLAHDGSHTARPAPKPSQARHAPKVDHDVLDWLTESGIDEARKHLDQANTATLQAALRRARRRSNTKVLVQMFTTRLRKLNVSAVSARKGK